MHLENLEDFYPLSPMQEGMLFHTISSPHSGMYVLQQTCTLVGKLDVRAFEHAWQQVLGRHPILRTRFLWEGLKRPVQVVERGPKLTADRLDWRGLAEPEQTARLGAYLEADRVRGFDLSIAPLMRLALIRIKEDTHYFIWSYHHLVLDGWSMSLVIKDVFAFYEASRQNQDLRLEQPRPYRDYIAWLQRQDMAKAEGFWRQTLKGFTAPTHIKATPASQEDLCASYGVPVSDATREALRSFARKNQLSLNTLFQGAWALLLSRYSGQQDVLFGSVVSGRPPDLAGIETMVGLFINTLPVRVRVPADAWLLPWLKDLQAQHLEAQQYEYSPLIQVQKWSELPRGVSLFETLLAFENYPVDAPAREESKSVDVLGAPVSELPSRPHTNYPLSVGVMPGQYLVLGITYDSRRFDKAAIVGIGSDLQRLLDSIAADPQQRLASLLASDRQEASRADNAKDQEERFEDIYARSNLTKNQLLFWIGQRMRPGVPAYNMLNSIPISADINPDHFRKAFQTLVNSSDALRTVIDEIDGVPRQRVLPHLSYEMKYIDFSKSADAEVQYQDWLHKHCQAPFDFQERLFDSTLVRISERKFAWNIKYHHIILDGVGLSIIFQRLHELYGCSIEGRLAETVELPRFEDFITYNRTYQESQRCVQDEAYWKRKLAAPLDPITYYSATALKQTTRVERLTLEIGEERRRKLNAIAAEKEISIGSPLLSGLAILSALLLTFLYVIGGNERPSIATPFQNRRSKAFKETIGLFMQIFPIRVHIEPGDTFLSLIKKVAAEIFEILEHSEYTLRGTLHGKSYHAVLNYYPVPVTHAAGSVIDPERHAEWIQPGYGDEHLALAATSEMDGLPRRMWLDFDCDAFTPQQRGQAMRHFLRVIDAFLDDYKQPLVRISLLSEEEERQPVTNRPASALVSERLPCEPRDAG